MRKTYAFFITISLLLLIFSLPSVGYAERVDYSVKAQIPDNQLDNLNTYFDLHVGEDHAQTLNVVVMNHSADAIVIRPSVFPAITNNQGIIIYERHDDRMEYPITQFLSFTEELVTIPAHSSKVISADLVIDQFNFEGVMLGGLHFEQVTDEQQDEGIQINNKHAYVIGVQLSQTQEEIDPEVDFEKAYLDTKDYEPAVVLKLENPSPMILDNLKISLDLQKDNEQVALKHNERMIKFAPRSFVDLAFKVDEYPLEPGEYTVSLTAEYLENEWHWRDTFIIEQTDIEYIQSQSLAEADDEQLADSRTYFYLIILLLATVVLLLAYIVYLRKKNNKKTPD